VKKPSYRKLKQMLEDAETAFRQVQSNNLNQGSELVQLRETVKKLSNDLEHKDRALREEYARACQREANHKGEIRNYEAVNNTNWLRVTQAERRADTAERRVKELEAKLEAVRLVIR
jgi:F0F1-type ATP synthase membrane subunit b/b'